MNFKIQLTEARKEKKNFLILYFYILSKSKSSPVSAIAVAIIFKRTVNNQLKIKNILAYVKLF